MPAGLRFTITVAGDTQVDRMLLRFGERIANPLPLYESLAEDLMNIERDQFDSEGGHGSGGWAPLAPATLAKKSAMGQPSAILQATQALMNSLTQRGAEGQILNITPEFMRFGTEISYAGFHQHGTRNMPMRKVMDLTDAEKVYLMKKIQYFIMKGEVAAL